MRSLPVVHWPSLSVIASGFFFFFFFFKFIYLQKPKDNQIIIREKNSILSDNEFVLLNLSNGYFGRLLTRNYMHQLFLALLNAYSCCKLPKHTRKEVVLQHLLGYKDHFHVRNI